MVNKVILVGNVGKDPEIRHFDNNVKNATFSLATSETFNNRNTGERQDKTEWHNIVAWRGLADLAENYIRKGQQLYVEGRLRHRTYEDQQGQTRYITDIQADVIRLLGRRGDNEGRSVPPPSEVPPEETTSFSPSQNTGGSAPASNTEASKDEEEVDDLPF